MRNTSAAAPSWACFEFCQPHDAGAGYLGNMSYPNNMLDKLGGAQVVDEHTEARYG
jgi:hypothetical protein